MMAVLTFFLVIISATALWQNAFHVNSFLFDKKLTYYKEISKTIFQITELEYGTTSKVLNTIDFQNYDAIKFQNEMYVFYLSPFQKLHGLTQEACYLIFSPRLQEILQNEILVSAKKVCYYLCNQYYKTKFNVSEKQYNISLEYLNNLFDDDGEVKQLFDEELRLKTIGYYWSAMKKSICRIIYG